MTAQTYKNFCTAREKFRKLCRTLSTELGGTNSALLIAQQKLSDTRQGKAYTVETPVVYNTSLDDVTLADEIGLILVADNPGVQEQKKEIRRYLVGLSGKLAENFFTKETALGINFRKNVIILNKTPIHTPRTAELKTLAALGGNDSRHIEKALQKSQLEMAQLLGEFWRALKTPVWVIGYSEMKKNGIFEVYTEALRRDAALLESLLLFRHFSMNQFAIELSQKRLPDESTAAALLRIGSAHKEAVLVT
jgi:RNase P/RNase MRP subunit POP5